MVCLWIEHVNLVAIAGTTILVPCHCNPAEDQASAAQISSTGAWSSDE